MELSINDIKELVCGNDAKTIVDKRLDHGYCIAVINKGFVYVGDVSTDDEWVIIHNAKNIRKWVGGHGLSWYAKNGFDKDITLDDSGDIKIPFTELSHIIKCVSRA